MDDQQLLRRRKAGPDESRNPPPEANKPARPSTSQTKIPILSIFAIIAISHTISALYAPILDCDETYNYWEPLHYLLHGHGFQTWEYSPEYALRSWTYILIHAPPLALVRLFTTSKPAQFYLLRIILGLISAFTETRLYTVISTSLHPRIASIYVLITMFTPGIFHASTAFLPSSFAMYTSTLALASFLSSATPSGPPTAKGIMYFGMGALLGWPFAGVLILPFTYYDWLSAFITDDLFPTFRRYLDGIVRCLIILGLQVSIDTFFYRRLFIVPLRLVLYNVFPSLLSNTDPDSPTSNQPRGPDIFGTSPWHFYIQNLLLNFNIFFLLALASFPLLALQPFFPDRYQHTTIRTTPFRLTIFLSPFYLWLAIFTIQPHKEERFMYPAYPFLALNASTTLHLLYNYLHAITKKPNLKSNPSASISTKPPSPPTTTTTTTSKPTNPPLHLIPPILTTLTILTSLLLCNLRILGTITAYAAPMTIYSHLPPNITTHHPENTNNHSPPAAQILCLGKDWYRFPTNFLLQQHPSHPSPSSTHKRSFSSHIQAQVIPSSFHGLLPGTFFSPESPSSLNLFFTKSPTPGMPGLFPATHLIPPGMNDLNMYDPGKTISVQYCDYLIDSYFPTLQPTEAEPLYINDTRTWETVACERFLDAGATGLIGRLIYLPEWNIVPKRWRRRWGRHCLLRRRERDID